MFSLSVNGGLRAVRVVGLARPPSTGTNSPVNASVSAASWSRSSSFDSVAELSASAMMCRSTECVVLSCVTVAAR
jgi:hypothetical protein